MGKSNAKKFIERLEEKCINNDCDQFKTKEEGTRCNTCKLVAKSEEVLGYDCLRMNI